MDCLQATEILSQQHDGEALPADVLAEADAHCASCESCALFRDTLRALAAVSPPKPSEELLSRLVALGIDEAATRSQPATDDADGTTVTPIARERAWQWAPRFTAFAAAAAVVVIALGITAAGVIGVFGDRAGEETQRVVDVGGELAMPPASAPSTEGDTMMADTATVAPEYVALSGGVWLLTGPVTAQPSMLTTAGTVSTSLEASGTIAQRTAFWSGEDRDTLYVANAQAELLAFGRVTRGLGRAAYQLQTGTPPTRFGEWPTLPAEFVVPETPDGAPTFRFFGKDDLGLDVYVPMAGRVEDGFAVPPGTGTDDPAAGNPNWTWWAPVP